MALNNFNPVMAGMMDGVRIARQIQDSAMQKQAFQEQRQRRAREAQIAEIGFLDQLDQNSRPVQGGFVTRPGELQLEGAVDPMTGQKMKFDMPSPVDPNRHVVYKTTDGRTISVERLSPAEKIQRQREIGEMMNKIAAQGEYAKQVAHAEGMLHGKRGEMRLSQEQRDAAGIPVDVGEGQTVKVLPSEYSGTASLINARKPKATTEPTSAVALAARAADESLPASTRQGAQRALDLLTQYQRNSRPQRMGRGGAGGGNADSGGANPMVQAVLDNPSLFHNLTPTVKTAIAPALAAAGFQGFGAPIGEGEVTKIADIEDSLKAVAQLGEKLPQNKGLFGPFVGRVGPMNPYNESARSMQAEVDLLRQRVGKALEGGVLRKEDEAKYKKILPELSDTPEVAANKLSQLKSMLSRDLRTFQETSRATGRRPTQPPAAPQGAARPGSGGNRDPLGIR